MTVTKTETLTYIAPPQYHTSQPSIVTITETRWDNDPSTPTVYFSSSFTPQPTQYGNTTTRKTSKSDSHSVPTYCSLPTSSATESHPIECNDQCASAIATNSDDCSSLLTTTIYPTTVTSTVFGTSIKNTTIFAIVSTETDIDTESLTEITLTTATSTVETIVATNTITDTTATITTTTGTVTVTFVQPPFKKRAMDPTTACTASSQYLSACSCAGFTPTTVTMPTPTLIITSILNGTGNFQNARLRQR